MKIFSFPIFVLLTFFVFTESVFACSCYGGEVPGCVRADFADAVFIGKITKIELNPPRVVKQEDGDSYTTRTRWIHFDVEHPVKGISSLKTKVLTEAASSCRIDGLETGQRWVIFADGSESGTLSIGFCGGSYELSDKSKIAEVLAELTPAKGRQLISGTLGGRFSEPGIEITVRGQGQEFKTTTDLEGFRIVVPLPGKYKVSAVVPYSAKISAFDEEAEFKSTLGETESTLEYEVELAEGDCLYHMFNLQRVDLKATASIRGRVLNYKTEVHGEDYVRLHRLGLTEAETLDNYVTLDRIEDGFFEFKGLREGTYVLLLNKENFPEYDKPYLRTYLPGTTDYSGVQVVKLEQGQAITDLVFNLPEPLPQKVITGEIVYPDGKPVTVDLRFDYAALRFRLINPEAGKYSNILDEEVCDYTPKGFNDCDDFLTIDKTGKFSFKAFAGFTYLIEVEVETAKGKDKHGFAFLTVNDNNKPLRIIINRDGRADAFEFIQSQKRPERTGSK